MDNIALLPAEDFSLSSRSYWFITARSIYSRVSQSDELSSMRTSASYCGPVHSLQFLHHLIHAKQELPSVFSQLHLHHVGINGETSALLDSAGLVVLHELGPCPAGLLFRILHDIERDSLT